MNMSDGVNEQLDLNQWTNMHIRDFNRHDLSGLKEETEYDIRVVLQTSEERSPPSDMFIWFGHVHLIHNKDPFPSLTAPQYPPRNVEAVVMNGTAIRVTWKPPQDYPDKLSGMSYIIYYTPRENEHLALSRWTNMHIGDFNRYDLSGLKEETEYGIKVVLQTQEGRSPPSDMFIIRTGKAGRIFLHFCI